MLCSFRSVMCILSSELTAVKRISEKKRIILLYYYNHFWGARPNKTSSLAEFRGMKSLRVRQMEMIPTLFVAASNVLSGVKTILKDFAFRSPSPFVPPSLTSHAHTLARLLTRNRRKLFQVAKHRVYTAENSGESSPLDVTAK